MNRIIRPYGSRLRAERTRLGLSQAQMATASGRSKATQVAYEADTHVPDLEYLDRVESLGVDKVFVCTGTPAAEFAAKSFDWNLHRDIVIAIFDWADERGVQVPPRKLTDLIHLLYEEFVATRTVDPATLARALRLVA